jgi:pilus assembly protein CpaE
MSEGSGIIRVMIVDDVADTCDQLEKLLYFEKDIEVIGKASNGREAVAMAKDKRPDVILMDINMPEMDGIAATEAIVADNPAVQVIIMSVQGETDYLRRAMLAGAREFLVKPIGADDLYKSIRHVHGIAPRPSAQATPSGGERPTPGGDGEHGQVISVFSPKGGSGTSSIAANLAVALRQITHKKVALVDGNLVLGDLDVILNLVSTKNIVDLAERIDDLDYDLLNDVLATHPSQIKVLLAPANPQAGELVTTDHVRRILELMVTEFDYVVVATPSSFHKDKALVMLDLADRIVLLMTLELTCIKNIKIFLELTELLEYPREKMLLVLNKSDNRMNIRVDNIENNIKHKVAMQIANAGNDMALAINQGVPLVIDKRDQRAVKDIFALAGEIAQVAKVAPAKGAGAAQNGQPAQPRQKQGFLARWFGIGAK